ncbi:MAG: WD40-repeat-containing domain protein [Benniella sp.]|nr:MAG: WD40-repeat-containing domain protein [Benniella sp.]
MIISCRTEYLGADYRDRFQPGDRNKQSDSSLFQEAVIAPFSVDQVHAYIHRYVSIYQPTWHVGDYKQALELIPTLKDLMSDPFLMTLSLEVLPRMLDPGQHLSATQVTRVGLYDHFVEQWLERGKKRIRERDLDRQSRIIFDRLSDEGFTQNGIDFLKRLAVADKQLLREACPLRRNGNQHRFIHRSLLEYGLARAIFDPQVNTERRVTDRVMGRRGSTSSVLSFEINDLAQESSVTVEQEPDIDSPLVWRSFVNDYSLMQFLEERVQKEPLFKQQLLAYIEYSKEDKKWRTAAANAITILIRANVGFIGADLRGIRIPGADLSYGMTGVQFGDLPFLTEEVEVYSCAYSQDGKSLAVGLQNGNVDVYTTLNWEKTRTLSGHSGAVHRVAYSPSDDQIATASEDMTVRLWGSQTGSLQRIFIGHTWYVYWVAYSPQGDQVASASVDRTVRLWDVTTGDCIRTLQGHDRTVMCVAYSPNGYEIASCSLDCTVRLWRVDTGECCRILAGHSDWVRQIAFSPQGDGIASVSDGKTVRIWDTETEACRFVLTEHISGVEAVAYSSKGDQVASGGADGTVIYQQAIPSYPRSRTVRLWDVESGHCLQTLTGHTSVIRSIEFSPNDNQVASGSSDGTVRLWDISSRVSRFIPNGHIFSTAYSPQGDRIASGGQDYIVRLWDVDTGSCLNTLYGHFDEVECVTCTFSPQGDVVASASEDMTVKLWDVAAGECFKTLDGHTGAVMTVVYSPDGNKIASGSMDATVRIWDAGTGECCQILVGHTTCTWVRDVAYSPQGNQLASAGYDKAIRLWDVETGECCTRLTGHSDRVISVTYSRQGDLLVSGSWDKTVRLWDVATGQCRGEIQNFQGAVFGTAWSASSDYLITGCQDSTMLKWEVVNEGESCRARLLWSATNGVLTTKGASIQDVFGLSPLNKQLLRQRGAIGEPVNILKEAGKKVISMASMISKLKQPSALDSSSASGEI